MRRGRRITKRRPIEGRCTNCKHLPTFRTAVSPIMGACHTFVRALSPIPQQWCSIEMSGDPYKRYCDTFNLDDTISCQGNFKAPILNWIPSATRSSWTLQTTRGRTNLWLFSRLNDEKGKLYSCGTVECLNRTSWSRRFGLERNGLTKCTSRVPSPRHPELEWIHIRSLPVSGPYPRVIHF